MEENKERYVEIRFNCNDNFVYLSASVSATYWFYKASALHRYIMRLASSPSVSSAQHRGQTYL